VKDSDCTKQMLNDLQIASPCSVPWSTMGETASEAVRFCGQCSKNVYDISKLTTDEAALLLQQGAAAGSLPCMQLYRRFDGTIITDDCPVGLRRIRDTWRRVKSVAAAAAAFFLVGLPSAAQNKDLPVVKGKVAAPNQFKPSEPSVLRGEPMVTGGKPMMVPNHVGGIVAPSVPVKNAAASWEAVAMTKPSIKSLADRIKKIEAKPNISESEIETTFKLRLQMAQEADKQMVPAFAQAELAKLYDAASAVNPGSNLNKSLLRDILKARIANARLLKVDDSALQEQLQKLQTSK
jgi:hypothetical protein